MYDNLLDYLMGFFKCGFFWYTLAGVVLFFIYAALKDYLSEKLRWTVLYILFGGYILTLAGVMLTPWVEGGFIYPTEWFKASNWQSGAFFSLAASEWKFDFGFPDAWEELLTGKLVCALLFVPFGFLVPTLWKDVKVKTLTIGLVVAAAVELLQVVVNRSFGLVELAAEELGIAAGFVLFMFLYPLVKLWLEGKKKK
ncbi:MAG: VanZ family protein [Clostridia bacterium]|nr:VanZ family protein [Clostridia bacterium]